MGEAASSSGKSVLALRDFLERYYGPESWGRLVVKLPVDDQNALDGIIMPSRWYPTTTLVSAIEEAARTFGPLDFHERYGDHSARFSINAFYRFLLRFKTPHWILTRNKSMWPQFHSMGVWEMTMTENSFEGQLHDFAQPGTYCRVLVGWIRAAGRLTGAVNAEVMHPRCRKSGAPHCLFVGRW